MVAILPAAQCVQSLNDGLLTHDARRNGQYRTGDRHPVLPVVRKPVKKRRGDVRKILIGEFRKAGDDNDAERADAHRP